MFCIQLIGEEGFFLFVCFLYLAGPARLNSTNPASLTHKIFPAVSWSLAARKRSDLWFDNVLKRRQRRLFVRNMGLIVG